MIAVVKLNDWTAEIDEDGEWKSTDGLFEKFLRDTFPRERFPAVPWAGISRSSNQVRGFQEAFPEVEIEWKGEPAEEAPGIVY